MKEITCNYCNTIVKKVQVRKDCLKHYCSKKCFGLAKKSKRIKVECLSCKKEFLLCYSLYRRQNTNKIACSRECGSLLRRDEYSPFRTLFRTAKYGKNDCLITLKDIKNQWEKQQGVCPYTNLKMNLPLCRSRNFKQAPQNASLDRIDSEKPYTIENIQIVCLAINYAKNCFEESEFRDFFKKLTINMN